MVLVPPQTFCYEPDGFPVSGDLLYRAATDAPSDRLKKLLWQPGVAAFYEQPYFECLYHLSLICATAVSTPDFNAAPKPPSSPLRAPELPMVMVRSFKPSCA
jgi:hypothetical protein